MSTSDQAIQALIQTVESSNKSIERTNTIVQELSNNVKELVLTEHEHMLKLERQQEINEELKAAIKDVNENIKIQAKRTDEIMPVINRSIRAQAILDSVTVKVAVVGVLAVLALLGFKLT